MSLGKTVSECARGSARSCECQSGTLMPSRVVWPAVAEVEAKNGFRGWGPVARGTQCPAEFVEGLFKELESKSWMKGGGGDADSKIDEEAPTPERSPLVEHHDEAELEPSENEEEGREAP
eukprot:1137682-Rhodomonas_salina.2